MNEVREYSNHDMHKSWLTTLCIVCLQKCVCAVSVLLAGQEYCMLLLLISSETIYVIICATQDEFLCCQLMKSFAEIELSERTCPCNYIMRTFMPFSLPTKLCNRGASLAFMTI